MDNFAIDSASVVITEFGDYAIWLESPYQETAHLSYGLPISLKAIMELKASIDRVLTKIDTNSESE